MVGATKDRKVTYPLTPHFALKITLRGCSDYFAPSSNILGSDHGAKKTKNGVKGWHLVQRICANQVRAPKFFCTLTAIARRRKRPHDCDQTSGPVVELRLQMKSGEAARKRKIRSQSSRGTRWRMQAWYMLERVLVQVTGEVLELKAGVRQ